MKFTYFHLQNTLNKHKCKNDLPTIVTIFTLILAKISIISLRILTIWHKIHPIFTCQLPEICTIVQKICRQ